MNTTAHILVSEKLTAVLSLPAGYYYLLYLQVSLQSRDDKHKALSGNSRYNSYQAFHWLLRLLNL
jgi:hypothetical protein